MTSICIFRYCSATSESFVIIMGSEYKYSHRSLSSYYIVVVFIDPLQGLYAILFGDTVDWFHFPTT